MGLSGFVKPEVFHGDAPPAVMAPSLSIVVTTAAASGSVPAMVDQMNLLLGSLKDCMEARFVRFSQISASLPSCISMSNVSCQDASTISIDSVLVEVINTLSVEEWVFLRS